MKVYKVLSTIFTVMSLVALIMGIVLMAFGMIFGGNEALTLMTIGESGIFMGISLIYDKLFMKTEEEKETETEDGEDAE